MVFGSVEVEQHGSVITGDDNIRWFHIPVDDSRMLVKLRSGMTMAEKNAANQKMEQLTKDINILAENYPELKSSNNFMELQKTIADVEEHLQAARRLYNANVNTYNTKLVVFPSSIVANNMHAVKKPFFEAEEAKRQDVKMSF